MKRILIVAEYFAPNNHIASIRTTKLAKYFKLNEGYHVSVVSRKLRTNEYVDPILQSDLKYIDKHIVIEESWLIRKIFWVYNKLRTSKDRTEAKNETIIKSKKNNVYSVLFSTLKKIFSNTDIFTFFATKAYSKRAKKQIQKMCNQYDVIITSSGTFSANVLGRLAKRANSNILWIADFRDPLINEFPKKKHRTYYNKICKEIIKNADVITGVSDACVEIFKKDFKREILTVCNGFDDDDIKSIDIVSNEKFTLTYPGRLYTGKRDLSIFFKAISELINETRINGNKIVINYLGDESPLFLEQTGKYELHDVCKTYGKVDRVKSLQLQLSSHILLLASWNNLGDTGVITGKFLEYMMINKPIICSVMGNLPDSLLKRMIASANNGIVWEQANDEFDYPLIKDYILKQYKQYEAGLPLYFAPNTDYIKQFRYENIASKFIKIIETHEKIRN